MSKVTIFDSGETDFTTRGLGILKDVTVCTVEEYKNGMYELYMEYPLMGIREELIQEERILQASTPRGNQLFRIYKIGKSDGSWNIKVYAKHIFYDLLDNFIEDINITQRSATAAIDHIMTHTQFEHPFSWNCDLTTQAAARIVRMNPVEAIMGTDDNTFLNRWGGEFERDNFRIGVHKRYGEDRGIVIKYGKNLKGLDVDTDLSSVVTRIMPEGYNGLFLPEKYVDSPYIGSYHNPKIQKIEFGDIKAQEEGGDDPDALPLEEALEKLRNAARMQFEDGKIDLPQTTVKVDLQALERTEEYKDYAVLERLYPFDTVTVRHYALGIDISVDMNYYKWDCIEDRYEGIELGNTARNLFDGIKREINQNQTDLEKKIGSAEDTAYKQAVAAATELINNGLGGHVIKTRDELLIMDTPDINTAKSVWRWNLKGLGHSKNGYNGPYETAMTADGKINAERILVGILNATLIKAGTLSIGGESDLKIIIHDKNKKQIGSWDDSGIQAIGTYKAMHTDGSYTEMGAEGLKHHKGNSEENYHYLSYAGSVKLTNFTWINNASCTTATTTIQLPDDFKNKEINFVPYLQGIETKYPDSGYTWVYEVMSKIGFTVVSVDKDNARVTLKTEIGIYCMGGESDSGVLVAKGPSRPKSVTVAYTAIA